MSAKMIAHKKHTQSGSRLFSVEAKQSRQDEKSQKNKHKKECSALM